MPSRRGITPCFQILITSARQQEEGAISPTRQEGSRHTGLHCGPGLSVLPSCQVSESGQSDITVLCSVSGPGGSLGPAVSGYHGWGVSAPRIHMMLQLSASLGLVTQPFPRWLRSLWSCVQVLSHPKGRNPTLTAPAPATAAFVVRTSQCHVAVRSQARISIKRRYPGVNHQPGSVERGTKKVWFDRKPTSTRKREKFSYINF